VSNGIGLVIEGMVAILLVLTIGYCIVLNSRLKMLKADEQALKATISELITATEIAGLKLTVRDCDLSLGERLRNAEQLSGEIAHQIDDGRAVLERLTRIVLAARPPGPAPALGAIGPDVQAIAEAAQAFAARSRVRPPGVAA
jgi:ABC-type glucose/galactose transport system permease subunit